MNVSIWPKMIALVDMNCFFAAIEQRDHHAWRGQAVAVTNGRLGSTIITCSYEARAFGVHTGMRLREARQYCPGLIQAPSRPQIYAATSTAIMQALQQITPDLEVFSVDEAFLDLTHCQQLYQGPRDIGQRIKQLVKQASGGLLCSVGISGDKTTAKFAAKRRKPDGLTIIHPEDAARVLAPYPVTELSGINKGIASFLRRYGVVLCGDMHKIPISILAQRYGNPGRRIWLMAQGLDPDKVQPQNRAPKSIGHGKVMPPETKDKRLILVYLQHMSEKVAGRLRQHQMQAEWFFIGIKTSNGWLKQTLSSGFYTDDGRLIYKMCRQFIHQCWQGQGVWQVQVTALSPRQGQQYDLFMNFDEQRARHEINEAIDSINQRFGEFAVAPASLLERSEMPNVIAPAWQPSGHRKTV